MTIKTLLPLLITGLAAPLFFTSCAEMASSSADSKYVTFKSRPDYKSGSKVFRDEELLATANSSNTKIRIDLSDQRTQLMVGEKVALDTPCCTGKAGKRTPKGTFPLKEKIRHKRSTIFGSLYRGGRKVHGGDRRKYRGSYDRYVGASLPYWMRLTGDGIGMHGSGYVHRYPGSNGCIRLPHSVVPTIYHKVRKGTPIHVVE